MNMDEAKLSDKDRNPISDIVPIFVYAMPCACLTGDDVRLLMKLKILYENYAVLFSLSSLSGCPYSDLCEHKVCSDIGDHRTLSDSQSSPSCSSSPKTSSSAFLTSKPNSSDLTIVSVNSSSSVLTADHCDIHMRRNPYPSAGHFSASLPQNSNCTDRKQCVKSSRRPGRNCVSKPEQLQHALEEIGFIFHQLPTLKPREPCSSNQNRQSIDKDKQPKSVIYLLDDRSRTLRISIQMYLKKVIQFHITKAAKVLNR